MNSLKVLGFPDALKDQLECPGPLRTDPGPRNTPLPRGSGAEPTRDPSWSLRDHETPHETLYLASEDYPQPVPSVSSVPSYRGCVQTVRVQEGGTNAHQPTDH